MNAYEELFAIADRMAGIASAASNVNIESPLREINDATAAVGKSFSGSWQGYHSRVYYADFKSPPPGAHFSQEWGLMDTMGSLGSHGDWREYDAEVVEQHVLRLAKHPDLEEARRANDAAVESFGEVKSEMISIFQSELEDSADRFLESLRDETENLSTLIPSEVAERITPKGQFMTRDTIVIGQGARLPPHMRCSMETRAIQHNLAVCSEAEKIARKAASHLERKAKRAKSEQRVGTNVFIGHGQTPAWRELKDFVQDRLRLPWDEFNRVPVAGVTNTARLAEMLDAAAVALLVMTAEDEMADGAHQARMNVIHEAGLFQGRLGFPRAVVLLEDGCQEFSNIAGLGQIRFPKGQISACFEEVRRVLEREGLIDDS